MTKKSKQILLDAVVVIEAHRGQYWDALCNAYRIALPATVMEDELFYFESDKGKKGLNASSWLKEGKVIRIDADLTHFEAIAQLLSSDFMASLDAGELEALAILASKEHQNFLFVTADRAAVKALGVLGWGYRGISVEELLNGICGKSVMAKLPPHFTKKWFQKAISEGFSEQHLWLRH
jgi:hypothetical protein